MNEVKQLSRRKYFIVEIPLLNSNNTRHKVLRSMTELQSLQVLRHQMGFLEKVAFSLPPER